MRLDDDRHKRFGRNTEGPAPAGFPMSCEWFGDNGRQRISRTLHAFTGFALRTVFKFVNPVRANPSGGNSEANFDIRLREGSSGDVLTFSSSSGTDSRAGRNILREKGPWSQVGSFNVAVPGGINSADRFEVHAVANGDIITVKAFKNGSGTPIMNWTVSDNPLNLHAGWVRFDSYGVNRVDFDEVPMGRPAMDPASLAAWASNLMLNM